MLSPFKVRQPKSAVFDWPKAVARLERSGLTLRQIAEGVGAGSAQAISEIKRAKTKEPRGMVAVNLHALHTRLVAQQRKERLARAQA